MRNGTSRILKELTLKKTYGSDCFGEGAIPPLKAGSELFNGTSVSVDKTFFPTHTTQITAVGLEPDEVIHVMHRQGDYVSYRPVGKTPLRITHKSPTIFLPGGQMYKLVMSHTGMVKRVFVHYNKQPDFDVAAWFGVYERAIRLRDVNT